MTGPSFWLWVSSFESPPWLLPWPWAVVVLKRILLRQAIKRILIVCYSKWFSMLDESTWNRFVVKIAEFDWLNPLSLILALHNALSDKLWSYIVFSDQYAPLSYFKPQCVCVIILLMTLPREIVEMVWVADLQHCCEFFQVLSRQSLYYEMDFLHISLLAYSLADF